MNTHINITPTQPLKINEWMLTNKTKSFYLNFSHDQQAVNQFSWNAYKQQFTHKQIRQEF